MEGYRLSFEYFEYFLKKWICEIYMSSYQAGQNSLEYVLSYEIFGRLFIFV